MNRTERWTYEGYECFIRCAHDRVDFGATGPKGNFRCECKYEEEVTPKIYELCKVTIIRQVDVYLESGPDMMTVDTSLKT